MDQSNWAAVESFSSTLLYQSNRTQDLDLNALRCCLSVYWISMSWCSFGKDVHCVCLWYLTCLHGLFPFARPYQPGCWEICHYLKPWGVELSPLLTSRRIEQTTSHVCSSNVLSLSLQSLIFGYYWQLLWPHLRMCAKSCVEKIWEAERKGDNWAEMILRDACFPNYLSLPGLVDINRGVMFLFLKNKLCLGRK